MSAASAAHERILSVIAAYEADEMTLEDFQARIRSTVDVLESNQSDLRRRLELAETHLEEIAFTELLVEQKPAARAVAAELRQRLLWVMTERYTCPVCGYNGLSEPPRSSSGGGSYEICRSCGFEFGVTDDDLAFSYEDWRERWIQRGMPWDSEGRHPRPRGWDPAAQLHRLLES